MAIFILLSTLTDDGAETLREQPDRILEVNRELEAYGARVLHQWATLGPYDFVNVVEAPDNLAIARVSVELSARGSIRLMTLAAVPIEDLIAGLQPAAEDRSDDPLDHAGEDAV
jgi:uncharacterized protein with GYD domain